MFSLEIKQKRNKNRFLVIMIFRGLYNFLSRICRLIRIQESAKIFMPQRYP